MVLVHGDYSPKNILMVPDDRIWVLDCEPAHYGNPVFDIAFCTHHLMLKSIHLGSMRHLEERGFHVVETDLGERIIQLACERPFHLVFPAVHKTVKEVAELFSQPVGYDVSPKLDDVMRAVREP